MSEPSLLIRFSKDRRLVVLDIETAAFNAGTALDAMNSRIVCIGLLVDNGIGLQEIALVAEDEAHLLNEFWNIIQPSDLVVGHNIIDFDLNFIKQRSWILNVKPSRAFDLRRYYTTEVKDTLQMWTNWGFKKGVTLDALAAALGCGGKNGHGADVADWWAEGDFESIKEYCMNDVRVTYAIYCRLMYREPRSFDYSAQTRSASTVQRSETLKSRARGRRSPAFARTVGDASPIVQVLGTIKAGGSNDKEIEIREEQGTTEANETNANGISRRRHNRFLENDRR
jgi:DNA polymerase elongation subunit (family B)